MKNLQMIGKLQDPIKKFKYQHKLALNHDNFYIKKNGKSPNLGNISAMYPPVGHYTCITVAT